MVQDGLQIQRPIHVETIIIENLTVVPETPPPAGLGHPGPHRLRRGLFAARVRRPVVRSRGTGGDGRTPWITQLHCQRCRRTVGPDRRPHRLTVVQPLSRRWIHWALLAPGPMAVQLLPQRSQQRPHQIAAGNLTTRTLTNHRVVVRSVPG